MNLKKNVIYSNRKTLSIQIDDEGILIVKAPKNTSNRIIDAFINKNSKWIENKQIEVRKKNIKLKNHKYLERELLELKHKARKHLSKRLKQLLGREVKLKEEVDSKVVVGLIVTVGSLVLDGSLKNKIRQQATDIDAKVSE